MYKERPTKWYVMMLILVFIAVHGISIFITGTFWDDWLSLFKDVATKNMEGIESGRPYYSAVIELVWHLPGYSYRLLSFLTYLGTTLLFFFTLVELNSFSVSTCFSAAIIFICVPSNDARVLLANYPYALGMFLFVLASFILIKNDGILGSFGKRFFVLALYTASYTLNSNLVMYVWVILYMLIRHKQNIYKYTEFVLLPIVFFAANKIMFPVYGAYANYNIVTGLS